MVEQGTGQGWELGGKSSRLCLAQCHGIISPLDAIWLRVWRLVSRQARLGSVPALVPEGEGGMCPEEFLLLHVGSVHIAEFREGIVPCVLACPPSSTTSGRLTLQCQPIIFFWILWRVNSSFSALESCLSTSIITKFHRLGASTADMYFSQFWLQVREQVPAQFVSGARPPSGLWTATLPGSPRDPIVTSSKPSSFSVTPPPNAIALGVRALTCEFGGQGGYSTVESRCVLPVWLPYTS